VLKAFVPSNKQCWSRAGRYAKIVNTRPASRLADRTTLAGFDGVHAEDRIPAGNTPS
jgi:hypothetical protein